MNGIITLALKDLRLLSRDRLGLFFIVVFPVIMGLFFGVVGGSFADSGSVKLQVAVVDEDGTEMSRLFAEKLARMEALEVRRTTRDEAIRQVRKRALVGFITLPAGFGETAGIFWAEQPAIEIGVDPSRMAEAGMLQGYVMQGMGQLVQKRFSDPAAMRGQLQKTAASMDQDQTMPAAQKAILKGLLSTVDGFLGSLGDSMERLSASGSDSGPSMELAKVEVKPVTGSSTGRDALLSKLRSQWDISFPAAMMWGLMGCVAGFAITVVRERTEGTFLRLTVAPISRVQILAGKGLACFLTCVAVIVFMMVLGKFLGIQLARPGLLVVATVCVSLSFVGMMMLMSVIGRSEQAVAGGGWALIVVMCMFGGGMIPLAFMPEFMKPVSDFSPVKWGILALEGAIWRGFTFGEMLVPCGILLAMGAVCFACGSLILSRIRA